MRLIITKYDIDKMLLFYFMLLLFYYYVIILKLLSDKYI